MTLLCVCVSFLLHVIWILENQATHATTCLCCFCFQSIDLLLLLFCCRIWWRTLCLSTEKTWRIFNIEARKNQMQPQSCLILWRPNNGNCDKLERSGKQEVHFKTKKAPESTSKHLDFSDFVFQLLYLIRGGSKSSKWIKVNQRIKRAILQTCLILNCCKTI